MSSYAFPHARSTANGHARQLSKSTDQLRDRIEDYLGGSSHSHEEELPLYKDKPRNASKRRDFWKLPLIRRGQRRWLVLIAVLLLLWWFGHSVIAWVSVSEVNWSTRQKMVRGAFVTSWDDYAKYAWGKDEYSPISHSGSYMIHRKDDGSSVNAGAGWIIVDGLDTAILMNCTDQVAQARKWIKTSLDFGKLDGQINTFETTIRVLGGLLSAHYLSTSFPHLAAQRDDDRGQKGEDLYLEKAADLAERLLGAFETPTGIPLADINLNTSHGIAASEMMGTSSTAEAGTLQLELKYMAKLTGEPLYWTVAEKVIAALDEPRMEDGLVPIYVDPNTGKYQGKNIRLGSRGDSYYEYLIKQYLQTGETIYKEMWDEALEGIKRHLITWSKTADFTVLAERPSGLDGQWSGKMDHLTCFLPGTIALAVTGGRTVDEAKKAMGGSWGHKQEEDLLLAEELMKTCWGMYVVTPTGLAPEITYMVIDDPPRRWNFDDGWKQPRSSEDFDDSKDKAYKSKTAPWRSDYDIRPNDVHNLQRPEAVESLYYLWRITGKPIYREWGWRMFKSFAEYSKVVGSAGAITGYTSLESVMKVPPRHLTTVVAGTNMAHSMGGKGITFARDNMEGFWLAETLKYFYLLFSGEVADEWFDLTKVVINTEAHFFPRFNIAGHSVFKTGWTRNARTPPTEAS